MKKRVIMWYFLFKAPYILHPINTRKYNLWIKRRGISLKIIEDISEGGGGLVYRVN